MNQRTVLKFWTHQETETHGPNIHRQSVSGTFNIMVDYSFQHFGYGYLSFCSFYFFLFVSFMYITDHNLWSHLIKIWGLYPHLFLKKKKSQLQANIFCCFFRKFICVKIVVLNTTDTISNVLNFSSVANLPTYAQPPT
jgi:hypothetical protein